MEESSSDKIKLSCPDGFHFQNTNETTRTLEYKDENTNEYVCEKDSVSEDQVKIYVKFRSKYSTAISLNV